jgi:hypothetical protein
VTQVPEGLRFERFDPTAARGIRDTVQDVYTRSYIDAIASGDPFETVEAFMERFDAYAAADGSGFELVLAELDGEPVGQAWGWPLAPKSRWWEGLSLDDNGDPRMFTFEDGRRTFALSEIMVVVEHTGRHVARALHDALVRARPEQRATLLVDPPNRRAYDTYLHWGWYRVGSLRPAWPDAPLFDVLMLDLH